MRGSGGIAPRAARQDYPTRNVLLMGRIQDPRLCRQSRTSGNTRTQLVRGAPVIF